MSQQKNGADVIKVFVASTPSEWLPLKVLEFSIKETTSLDVEVQGLYTFNRLIAQPKELKNYPRTPFSFQRFLIPELCDFKGKAIYLDSDMQVFFNIKDLWEHEFGECDLQTVQDAGHGRRGQFSVMLLNCENLAWSVDDIVNNLDTGMLSYEELMYEMKPGKKIGKDISPHWNSLETYVEGETKLLHYTDMNTQPWVSTNNPLGYLWVACLRRAINSGFISKDELKREVLAGHVRPSLLAQVDLGCDDILDLPRSMLKPDTLFLPPYKKIKSAHARPWTSLRSGMYAFAKRYYYKLCGAMNFK